MDLGRRSTLGWLSAAAVGSLFASALSAQETGTLTVSNAWARPTPPALKVGAAYLAIVNHGAKADRLLSAVSTVADAVEFHETRESGGVMQMRQVTFVDCPAGATVKASPGGLHLMLFGLKQPLQAGTSFSLNLKFRDAGVLAVKVAVEARE